METAYPCVTDIYIICGRRRTIKCSSNQNVWSEYYNMLPCLSAKYEFAYPSAPCLRRHDTSSAQRMKGANIVILWVLYCNVFSLMIETWGNLTALHSILHKCPLSLSRMLVSGFSEHVHVFWRRHGFAA